MTDTAAAVFNAYAGEYDLARRRLVPEFDRFYGAAVRTLELAAPGPLARVLDLGAGTGLLSQHVLAAHPAARVTLLDAAPAMLEQAGGRLGDRVDAVHVQAFAEPLPPGPWDAVVSSMAIHHLEADAQADLYRRAAQELRPGGVLVNAEIVEGPTPALEAIYARWHEQAARALGTDDAEWAAALKRFEQDRCSSVEAGLAMLRAAGLEDVACPWADGRFAVLLGRRPA